MADLLIDAGELTEYGRRIGRSAALADRAIAASVAKAALNIKARTREDVAGSSDKGLRQIPIAYETHDAGSLHSADIAPVDAGAGNLANIAFYGTAKGGGTHRPPDEHARGELPVLAGYVSDALDMVIAAAVGL